MTAVEHARDTPFGALLAASHDYHGIALDLYGTLGAEGYEVKHVLIPGSLVAITECVSEAAMKEMSAALIVTPSDISKWLYDVSLFGVEGMA